MKKTILNSWHNQNSGDMVDFGGWEMPIRYELGITQEHLKTRKYGGLFDVSHMGRFYIKGDQSLDFLQHVLTNDASALNPGKAQYTIIANDNGGAIDDAYLSQIEVNDYILVVNASNKAKDWDWIAEQSKQFPNATIEDKSDDIAMIALQGPESRKVLEEIVGTDCLPGEKRNNLVTADYDGEQLIITSTGYTGEPVNSELFVPNSKAVELWETILDHGERYGIVPVGLGARDSLRLEAGLPLYGHEYGLDKEGKEMPILAIPIAKYAVSLSPAKGDFIGKEALQKQYDELKRIGNKEQFEAEYLPKMIKFIDIMGMGAAREGSKVFIEEKEVGEVTSGSMISYWKFDDDKGLFTEKKAKRSICFAYVDSAIANGEKAEVDVGGRMLNGMFVPRYIKNNAPPYAIPLLKKK